MILYRDKDGNETPIAGTQVTGELIPSISHYKEGTIKNTIDLAAGAFQDIAVTFDGEMPDADYVVNIDYKIGAGLAQWGYNTRTKNGFTIFVENCGTRTIGANTVEIHWQAFKLMTDQSYKLDSDQIAANKSNIAGLKANEFVNYSLNYFQPLTDVLHNENWTASFTRDYLTGTIPSTLVGEWFSVIQWNNVHFASQIWVNENGNAWSRFRYRAGGASRGWGDFKRLDNGEIKDLDAVQDWSSLLTANTPAGSYSFSEPYVRAKRFGNHWEVFGRFRIRITPSQNYSEIGIGYSLTGKSWNIVVDNAIVAGRADALKLYSWGGDLHVAMRDANFLANTAYDVLVTFTGIVG